jgi:5-methylcytosine-specific restriction protein A
MDEITWQELGHTPDLVRQKAALIRAAIEIADNHDAGAESDDWEFPEGRLVTDAHKRRERHPGLRAKLIAARKRQGRLVCEVCSAVPSTRFEDAIFETHHILPLSAGPARATKLADLALLCANCHRLIHRAISVEARWLSIEQAKVILASAQASYSSGSQVP